MRHSEWIVRDCVLDEETLHKNESIFSTSNGYLGVRGNFEEGYGGRGKTLRGAYLNGCYETVRIGYDERLYGFPERKQAIVNVHDFQTVFLTIDGEPFDIFQGRLLAFERVLTMRDGVCRRSAEWESPGGKRVRIDITRMASFAVKELFTIDYRVTPLNFEGEIGFTSEAGADVINYCDREDPRNNSRPVKSLRFLRGGAEDGILYLESETVNSGIGVVTSLCHTLGKEGEFTYTEDGMRVKAAVKTCAKQDEQVRFVTYAHCLDSVTCGHPGDIWERAMALARGTRGTIDDLYEKQRAFLDSRWDMADVEIDSGDDVNESLRYCIYQLICQGAMCGGSIPAKGLSGEGYEGHYFWDTEVFIHPFLALNDPDTARSQLLYRYDTLDAARENARMLGHKTGAAYPWRTITGSECSTFFPGGAAQYHINADIAYAVIHYYWVTGDESLLFKEGAEILFETARLWMELGHFFGGAFRIDTVTGPDEYTCLVNNNYYTNILARHNLKWAVKVYHMLLTREDHAVIDRIGLTHHEVAAFEKAYQNMYLPYDDALGITPQDDSFLNKKLWDFEHTPRDHHPLLLHYHPMLLYRYQVCKQADVLLAYYLFQKDHLKELMQKSYEYYEKITTHDSSLSECVFSIMAARLGKTEKAYDYFKKTVRLDLDDSDRNTKDGLHMANMGGSYLCVLGGFAGLTIDEDGIGLAPVLPGKWRSYRFRFRYRDSVFEVTVHGEGTDIRRISGEPKTIKLYDTKKSY